MRALVCGGRGLDAAQVINWLERFGHEAVRETFGDYRTSTRITSIIHGGARGADEGAARWGEGEGIPVHAYPANWKKHGKAAGPLRNQRMMREASPEIVIAFPGGRGTANMLEIAEGEFCPIYRVIDLAGGRRA